jgi:hypothetical protein
VTAAKTRASGLAGRPRCSHIEIMRIVMGFVFLALFGLLAAAIYYAYGIWNALESADMPVWMYVAMAGGILFSLLVGCGLMALVFYSSRHGYDERVAGSEYDER